MAQAHYHVSYFPGLRLNTAIFAQDNTQDEYIRDHTLLHSDTKLTVFDPETARTCFSVDVNAS